MSRIAAAIVTEFSNAYHWSRGTSRDGRGDGLVRSHNYFGGGSGHGLYWSVRETPLGSHRSVDRGSSFDRSDGRGSSVEHGPSHARPFEEPT